MTKNQISKLTFIFLTIFSLMFLSGCSKKKHSRLSASKSLESILIECVPLAIFTSETSQCIATGTYSDDSTQNITSFVTWTSSNTMVATINSNGLVTGLSTGDTNIQSTFQSLNSNVILLSVNAKARALMVSQSYLNTSGQFPLLATSTDDGVTWSYTITSSALTGGSLNMPTDAATNPNAYLAPGGCNGDICMASGGYQNSSGTFPLLAVSTDGGVTWSYKITSSASTGGSLDMPTDAATNPNVFNFDPGGCNGNICTAAASYQNSSGTFPLLAVSTDAGVTWSYKITSSASTGGSLDMPTDAATNPNIFDFFTGGCNGNICTAAGSYQNSSGQFPLLAVSTDGGVTWSYKITSSASTGGSLDMPTDAATDPSVFNFSSGGCNGNICMASGNYRNSSGLFPLLAVSTDGGVTWSYKITSSALTGGSLDMPTDAATDPNASLDPGGCNGNICTAAGSYQNSSGFFFPLLAISTDGGVTWSYKITSSASTGGSLDMPTDAATDPGVSFSPGGCNSNICTAAGNYLNSSGQFPLLAVSTDGGVTWSYKITSSASTGGSLDMPTDAATDPVVSLSPGGCNGNICTAAGQYQNSSGFFPLLAVSTDGGVTWSYKITSSASTGGSLDMPTDAATDPNVLLSPGGCNGNICTAASSYQNSLGQFPLLAVSTDGGVTWSYKITSSALTGGSLAMPTDAAIDPVALLLPFLTL